MQFASFPRSDVTPEGLIAGNTLLAKRKPDGTFRINENTLAKFCDNNCPSQTLHHLNRAGELMAKVKVSDWDDRTPHDMHPIPVLAQVKMHLALAVPMPFPFHKYSPDQPRVPAGNPDGGQWTSEGGASGNSADHKGKYQVADAGNIRTDASVNNDKSSVKAVPVTLDDGSAVTDPVTGKSLLMPADVSLNDNVKFGETISDLPSKIVGTPPDENNDLSLRETAMTAAFMRGGAMDYQRTYSNQMDSKGNALLNQDYIDFGNYNYGAVGAAADYSLPQLLDAAAVINSTNVFNPKINVVRNPFAATADNPWMSNTHNNRFITMGFQDYKAGKITSGEK